MNTKNWLISFAGASIVALAAGAFAQTYPNKPVKFITASTGSPQDVIGRMFAQKNARELGSIYCGGQPCRCRCIDFNTGGC